ncbi:predicted protein [Streptomyces viridochromogenes DSM 40736]|uniref:Predicted protein n=1 Tax=Streptomyces viridochromogenes (strain DSM 40736 / JCM 4977 / BCRC 1201 / Tue 494) TaxID=591159 RepID=D9XDK9_STRVT|nr:predicted protein [Streptomyces viridochromogenes DSM 40736]
MADDGQDGRKRKEGEKPTRRRQVLSVGLPLHAGEVCGESFGRCPGQRQEVSNNVRQVERPGGKIPCRVGE